MASTKLKILLFGSIVDTQTFYSKLNALQSSKAGPFDLAIVVGNAPPLAELEKLSFPLPVYLHTADTVVEDEEKDEITKLADNLYAIGGNEGAIRMLEVPKRPPLVVAVCPRNVRSDAANVKRLLEQLSHVSYRGCDLLLSYELPQGAEQLLQTGEVTSFDVAHIALQARARYHVVPSTVFAQSPPFSHLKSSTSTKEILHTGRLLTMAPVVAQPADKKFVHALGLTPLQQLSTNELLQQQQQNPKPCPFTDASYPTDQSQNKAVATATTTTTAGLSEASARRLLAEDRQKESISRWNDASKTNNKRQIEEDDPENTTLFLHGLHKDVTGQLQTAVGNLALLQAFNLYGALKVRKPPNVSSSSFAFIEFPSHEQAVACLRATGGTMTINNVSLDLKWATTNSKKQKTTGPQRLTEQEAKDSSTVYFKIKGDGDIEAAGQLIKRWMETTLEDALNEGSEDRVTAVEEPALRVEMRFLQGFGFLDFASHAAASMALATLTGSTDGGKVTSDKSKPPGLSFDALYLNWAHSSEAKNEGGIIEDAETGFKFERKHFPPDSRQDCWFCLASASCEKHLIVGVFDSVYAAMPKGPVHPGHVLLIPVTHSSKGALQDANIADEMDSLKDKLRELASSEYGMDLFVFERAIQTKGGYHTHVQCIPVARKLGLKLQLTMLAQAKRIGMEMREINSDLGVQAVLNSDDDDNQGYFYAEIPVAGKEYKRFFYKATDSSQHVPLQFGREVLAAVLEKPDLAHWKSCVLDQAKEAAMAAALREGIAKIQ